MSDAIETPVATEPTPAPKAVKSRASKPRKATKKAKAKPKTIKAPGAGLRAAQVRMLKFLAKKTTPVGRQAIVVAATGRPGGTMDGSYLGNADPKDRKVAEARVGKPSLLTLGYVRAVANGENSRPLFQITAAGRAALAKAGK